MADTWEAYFQPGETLMWEGAPKPGVHGWPKIIGLAVFGLPFLLVGLGAFGTGGSMALFADSWSDFGLGLFLVAFSLMFVGLGGLLVLGQLYASVTAHRFIRYAVSTRCAYIAKTYWTKSLESYPIVRSTPLGLEKGRTADTVWFHVQVDKDSDGDRRTTRIAFDNIAEGDRVYALLRSIQIGTA